MKDRLHDLFVTYAQKLRVFALIGLAVLAYLAAGYLEKVHISEPLEPLRKLSSAPVSEFQVETPEEDRFLVSITGAVAKPGVYEVNSSSVIQDLIGLAGGYSKSADLAFVAQEIPLARKLEPAEQLYIPNTTERKLITGGSASSSSITKVNLNSATVEELDTLPGVGVSTAEKIVSARPFTAVEGLLEVPGIGESTYAKLKDLVVV